MENLLRAIDRLNEAKAANSPFHTILIHQHNVDQYARLVRIHTLNRAWQFCGKDGAR